MIPRSILDNYRLRLRQQDPMPSAWLGDFVSSYVEDFRQLEDDEQVRHICGLMETLFEIGVRHGKQLSLDALKEIIMKHR